MGIKIDKGIPLPMADSVKPTIFIGGNVGIPVWRAFSAYVAATGQNKSVAIENALRRATPVSFRKGIEAGAGIKAGTGIERRYGHVARGELKLIAPGTESVK